MTKKSFALAAIAAASIGTAASAAPVLTSYSFTATNFISFAPLQTVSGTFDLMLDNTTFAATLAAINLDIGSTHFSASNSSIQQLGAPYYYTIFGSLNGTATKDFTNDFEFILDVRQMSQTQAFNYSYVTDRGTYQTQTTFQRLTPPPVNPPVTPPVTPGVPEPETWSLLVLGFGATGYLIRRREPKRTARVA